MSKKPPIVIIDGIEYPILFEASEKDGKINVKLEIEYKSKPFAMSIELANAKEVYDAFEECIQSYRGKCK